MQPNDNAFDRLIDFIIRVGEFCAAVLAIAALIVLVLHVLHVLGYIPFEITLPVLPGQ